MKYFEVEFTIMPCSQVAQDLLSALAGEAGFETFEETANGLKGYVQQTLFDQSALDQVLEGFPLEDTHIIYNVQEAEDRDWNEQWEQEGFEPIDVRCQMANGRSRTLIIHDGRHLPSDISLKPSDLEVEIDAHLAFGTGTHETTRMICATLLGMNLSGMKVLDCGCGTGILGICALKLGAQYCVGYDIDEWSVDNTRHNAIINRVDDRLEPLHGDATMLSGFPAEFDLVMANINRNILLQDMERFVSVMRPKATLVLSGFYQSDCQLLEEKANNLGLMLKQTKNDGDWVCLVFQYQ
jgi:ribosomal protein L11 methyltransferase